jgi:hypothetical protein
VDVPVRVELVHVCFALLKQGVHFLLVDVDLRDASFVVFFVFKFLDFSLRLFSL